VLEEHATGSLGTEERIISKVRQWFRDIFETYMDRTSSSLPLCFFCLSRGVGWFFLRRSSR
jgi:hypothetical protein